MKRRGFFWAGVGVLVVGAMALGGAEYEVNCTNEKCGLHANLLLGGGRMTEMETGWCVACQDFVKVAWKREEGAEKHVKKMYIPATGETVDVIMCPKDGTPCVVIHDPKELKNCPKCGKELKWKEGAIVD